MTPLSGEQAGRLLEAMDRVEDDIRAMKGDIESLKSDLTKGKGLVAGLFLAAGGVGAFVKGMLDKVSGP